MSINKFSKIKKLFKGINNCGMLNVYCNKCKDYTEQHKPIEHLDVNNPIHKCKTLHKRIHQKYFCYLCEECDLYDDVFYYTLEDKNICVKCYDDLDKDHGEETLELLESGDYEIENFVDFLMEIKGVKEYINKYY